MKRCLVIVILVLALFMNSHAWAELRKSWGSWKPINFKRDMIPPQMLEWFDLDVISEKRPSYYYLQNKDIWDLPEETDIDIIVLDNLRIDVLTPIQIETLQDWIRSGIDVAITWGWVPQKLETLFGFKMKKLRRTGKKFYLNKKTIINLDIAEEKFKLSYQEVTTYLPDKALVIISTDASHNEVIMGIVYYGKGRIFFDLVSSWGNMNYTRSRFQLNLSQWLIGKDIPILTLKDVQEGFVLARIKLEDGQELFGKVSKPTDTHVRFENLKRKMTLPWKGIQWIEIKDENFRAKIPEFIPLYPKRE